MSAVKIIPVVGVTFAVGYPTNLHALNEVYLDHQGNEGPTVVLVRNPDNPHDANAVEVHVPALGELAMIGHIARDNAARLAPLLDAGIRFQAWVERVRIAAGRESNPGINIAITRAETPDA